MKLELDRKGLETLVRGSQANYNIFQNPLVQKAGHTHEEIDKLLKTILEKQYDNGEMDDVVSSYDIKIAFEKFKNK